MVSKVYSAQTGLLAARKVSVETDITRGLHAFTIVGLPDKAVEESRDRVSAAIKNSGLTSPKQKNEKVVISLAPASEKKEGPSFDLPIALSYLVNAGVVTFNPEEKLFLGELSLDGTLRPIKGALSVARFALEDGMKEVFVPKENAEEAALIGGILVYGAGSLREVIDHLNGDKKIEPSPKTMLRKSSRKTNSDFSDIRGQNKAKRGLLIAAAGGHNAAMFGPPGTGKTMLAKAFAGILPDLTYEEALEATSIHSVAGILTDVITEPPFRSPHHTSSHVAITGGGPNLRPGEITLAHTGVLFLDEFPEFDRRVIESLREPLEEKSISISRAKGTMKFPANLILIAAMNPCPCGNYGFRGKPCTCSPASLERYRRKLSGPIIDRIDIWLDVDRIPIEHLSGESTEEKSEKFRAAVERTRKIQEERYKDRNITKNAEMNARDIVTYIKFSPEAQETLNLAATRMGISPRVYHRLAKVARTIADLEGSLEICRDHILEAIEYRPKKFER